MADRDVAGALLVGGASRRFGSPKALAVFDGMTLAERAYRTLEDAFGRVIAVGKARDGIVLPFPVLDDGTDTRAAIVGVAAALRLSGAETCVVLPVDMPAVTAAVLRTLAAAADGADAAVPQSGPLPGAYRRSALVQLERRIEAGELALRGALAELRTRVVEVEPSLLRNVNLPSELAALAATSGRPRAARGRAGR